MPVPNAALRMLAIWLVYSLSSLAMTWFTIVTVHPRELPKMSQLEDSSRLLIFLFVLASAMAGMGSVVVLLTAAKAETAFWARIDIAAAVLAVLSSWATIHTLFTLRYAHLYYDHDRETEKRNGGLDFPDCKDPDYLDFAYFSFVVGMTSQTSDVSISDRSLRRLALIHGLIAFFFNVIVVALTINVVSGIIGK